MIGTQLFRSIIFLSDLLSNVQGTLYYSLTNVADKVVLTKIV